MPSLSDHGTTTSLGLGPLAASSAAGAASAALKAADCGYDSDLAGKDPGSAQRRPSADAGGSVSSSLGASGTSEVAAVRPLRSRDGTADDGNISIAGKQSAGDGGRGGGGGGTKTDRDGDRLRNLRSVLGELRARYSPHGLVVPGLLGDVDGDDPSDGYDDVDDDGGGVNVGGVGVGVEEIASAQQEVHVVRCGRRRRPRRRSSSNGSSSSSRIVGSPSGRGDRWPSFELVSDALDRGGDRLVVRIWHGSARWWNLNAAKSQNPGDAVVQLARAEVGAYRLARRALLEQHYARARGATAGAAAAAAGLGGGDGDGWEDGGGETTIPRVLFFSHDGDGPASSRTAAADDDDERRPQPYAIFEYVGEGSSHFAVPTPVDCSCSLDGAKADYHRSSTWHYDDSPATSMVKIRHEFGYDEPHPRHGRVPIDQSLSYALRIVRDVLVPIHSWFLDGGHSMDEGCNGNGGGESVNGGGGSGGGRDEEAVVARRQCRWALDALERPAPGGSGSRCRGASESGKRRPYTYGNMVELYERTAQSMGQRVSATANAPRTTAVPNGIGDRDGDGEGDELAGMFRLLLRCVERLRVEYDSHPPPPLPPVLCHLDLQPQNLLFGRGRRWRDDASSPHPVDDSSAAAEAMTPRVASLLDWEEAAYADPRFDLLLVCRKVVADLTQARAVWDRYSREALRDRFVVGRNNYDDEVEDCKLVPGGDVGVAMGPIEPWLRLEGVHSVLSLLRQGVGDGGRGKAWETRPDLADKIRREFLRLSALGWTFCATAVVDDDGEQLAN